MAEIARAARRVDGRGMVPTHVIMRSRALRSAFFAFFAVLQCGCMENLVRSRAASQFDCPETQIQTTSLGNSDYRAIGCGKEATYVCMASQTMTACTREGDIHATAATAETQATAMPRAATTPPPPLQREGVGTPYDAARDIAGRWLVEAERQCHTQPGPRGAGRAALTFAGDGRIAAVVLDPPFDSSDTGRCLSDRLRTMTVPPFQGPPVTVRVDFFLSSPSP